MTSEPSDFRIAAPLRARMLGGAIVTGALLVFAATAVVVLFVAPLWILTLAVLLCLGGIFAAGWLINRAWVVRLDASGYQVRLVRGAGVPRGRWSEVADVISTELADQQCLVLRRRDGDKTTIPIAAVAEHERLVDEVRRHLDGRSGRPTSRPTG